MPSLRLSAKILAICSISLLSPVTLAKEVVLTSSYICPLLCADDQGSVAQTPFIQELTETLEDMGHSLKVKINTQSRSRALTAMGISDMTLGTHYELSKNSRVQVLDAPLGSSPVILVFSPNNPVQLSSMRDLINYRLAWNKKISVDEKFKPMLNAMMHKGNLDMISEKNFTYNTLHRIHQGKTDLLLTSKPRYEEVLKRFNVEHPEAKFIAVPAMRMPGYNVHLALSSKTDLATHETKALEQVIAQLSAKTSAQLLAQRQLGQEQARQAQLLAQRP